MGLQDLQDAVREAAGPRVWGVGVGLARDGAVQGVSDDGDEVCLHVKQSGKAVPHEVFLWPDDAEWGCDCELPGDACIHVAAATIALTQGRKQGEALPAPKKTFRVSLQYNFRSEGSALAVDRVLRWPDGREEPLDGALADADVMVRREDAAAETLLLMQPAGKLGAEPLRRLLVLIGSDAEATLDGKAVGIEPEPVPFVVKVIDEDEGFRLGLYRPADLDDLFRGAALKKGKLRPTSHGDLTQDQRRMLVKGVHFKADEVGLLVSEYLPKLQEKAPVDIVTDRLPKQDALVPRVRVEMSEKPEGLQVKAEVVYTGPVQAPVTKGQELGQLVLRPDGLPEFRAPLVADRDVPMGGFHIRLMTAANSLLTKFTNGPAEAM